MTQTRSNAPLPAVAATPAQLKKIQDVISAHEERHKTKLGYPMIVAIRRKHVTDTWSCLIGMYDGKSAQLYRGTTYPGREPLLKPYTKHGTAVLAPGIYVAAYVIGKHRSRWPAFVQRKQVAVARDNNRNGVVDVVHVAATAHRGLFGINVHGTGDAASPQYTPPSRVGSWSAGCQVLQDTRNLNIMLEQARNSGRASFTLVLVEDIS